MGSFRGRFDFSIDAKGRINFPAKFRKSLNPESQDTLIICRAPDECLRAYPQDLWEEFETEFAAAPDTPEKLRHKRLIYNTLSDTTFDAQGRITITPAQIAIAGIQKEVVLVGQATYVEIWDPEKYKKYLGDENFGEVCFSNSGKAEKKNEC